MSSFRFSLFVGVLFTFVCSAQGADSGAGPNKFEQDPCKHLMELTGQLVSSDSLIRTIENMKRFLSEWQGHSAALGAQGYAFSEIGVADTLQAVYGPIVTFTTFSREVVDGDHFSLSTIIGGLLRQLKGRVIVASGGTMGNPDDPNTFGGGVGIAQTLAMQMKIRTLSLTAAGGFRKRAAPADFLFYSLGGFGSESRMMERVSKALVVIGGGDQAYNEAVEYLLYNASGFLVIVDDGLEGGTSSKLLNDTRFANLAKMDPTRIFIAPTGNAAGQMIAQKLGLHDRTRTVDPTLEQRRVEVLDPDMDPKHILPSARRIGWSGWSNWDKTTPDLKELGNSYVPRVVKALEHIHRLLAESGRQTIFMTSGNDPSRSSIPAFESLVHNLADPGATPNIRYVAVTADKLRVEELNKHVRSIFYVSPNWEGLTQQLIARIETFISAGGNQTVIDQAIQAAKLQRPHLHILGANTLSDMRIGNLVGTPGKDNGKNPNLVLKTPEEILDLDAPALFKILGIE